jgi:hypothetical protein
MGVHSNEGGSVILTTHAPFVPSDLPRDQVIIFRRSDEGTAQELGRGQVKATRPDIQTFGASYDQILEQCFGVTPPISQQSQAVIGHLLDSGDAAVVEAGLKLLGPSVERVLVVDHLDELKSS